MGRVYVIFVKLTDCSMSYQSCIFGRKGETPPPPLPPLNPLLHSCKPDVHQCSSLLFNVGDLMNGRAVIGTSSLA